ncbi:assimilatory sulfite reductase (NADPH) flavoprotein subunit [Bacillus weihaiensis]|uniref:assimilatory sulfite reductase (NADPH) n=1 Tax=Bacillus weihaiensis TaxID=1547283 RepID=A0A1L3MRA5_9BACI|nr:assimilatory sulfite reductase (NADPH) flavoprotein subunit [Bacillus weihaiensis]APH04879.1 sulfite reductase [NADPH] flavoprotein, alpha-component [Bacillus weihaiensis]
MQLQVINSPFSQEQVDLLNQLLPKLNENQKYWLSGYLTGTQAPGVTSIQNSGEAIQAGNVSATKGPASISKEVTILFGSQTGNAQSLAENAGKTLKEKGFDVTISSMSDFKPNSLKKVKNLLIVVSTHGEGEPPDNAIAFHEFLHGRRAPKLEDLRFSVLALGDTSYEFFCKTGIDFDQKLEALGGTRLFDRVDCDVDFEESASKWLKGIVEGLSNGDQVAEASDDKTQAPQVEQTEIVYSRTNPFHAEVLENLNLNGRGANKETRHLELSLEGSGITYEPGDALGIFPENDPELVGLILEETKWNPDEKVTINKDGDTLTVKEALTSYFEITVLTKAVLEKASAFTTNPDLAKLIEAENRDQLKAYIFGRDILDLLRDFKPWSFTAQDFLSILRKMPARLYSIASSIEANPEEVHLTIGAVRYEAHGRKRNGVCSILTAERVQPGDKLPIYIQKNKNFRLPENPETPIIMVGPGTGVAPFRSFMQEREETGAQGKSWMFFGDQHFVTDFLYQTEWQKWVKDGVLTKMDVAFSRDNEEKVYVQHRMLENSKEFFQWLEEGAVFYICGDKNYMAKDVHETLLTIIEKEGNMTRDKAEEYVAAMKKQKRYHRDVY